MRVNCIKIIFEKKMNAQDLCVALERLTLHPVEHTYLSDQFDPLQAKKHEYIVIHRQICFVLSELISVAR